MGTEVVNGSRTNFGPKVVETKAPYTVTFPSFKELHVPINYDDLPVVSANDVTVQSIPAYAWIESATLHVQEAFTSGGAATMSIGLYESDGTVIDLDGIDVDIALAAINAKGERVLCDGALVANTAGVGTAAGQVVVVESSGANPYTAGKGELVIRYHDLPA
jgi:hypothetical protein